MSGKHYLVKGVSRGLWFEDIGQYPWRGDVEAKEWGAKDSYGLNDYTKGISGIDEVSRYTPIENDCYIIIEYDPKDGFFRMRSKIRIRKGKVVFLSKKISRVQEWLEKRGQKYLGDGASIKLGDNQKIEVSHNCSIIAGDNCTITGMYDCSVTIGDNCFVNLGLGGFVKVGSYSRVVADEDSLLSGNIGSVLRWNGYWGSYEIKITESEKGKCFLGVVEKYQWTILSINEDGYVSFYHNSPTKETITSDSTKAEILKVLSRSYQQNEIKFAPGILENDDVK